MINQALMTRTSTAVANLYKSRKSILTNRSRMPTRKDSFDDDEEDGKKELNPCIELLCRQLDNRKSQLQRLYLNNCDLYDDDAINILKYMNPTLKKLFMNKNQLTKKFAVQFADTLDSLQTKLEEVGLKWNEINGEGGCLIANALIKSKSLKALDLSWNKLGVKSGTMKKGEIGTTWGEALAQNQTIVNLDLNFNIIG